MLKSVKDKASGLLLTGSVVASNISMALADDVFDVADSVFQDVYSKLLKMSTPVCGVIVIVSLLIAHFGGQKGVENGRKMAIGAGVTWVIINGLGLILNFIQPYIDGYSNIGF